MVNESQSSDKVVEPLLIGMFSEREVREIAQMCSSSDKVEVEIQVSQKGEQFFITRALIFAQCPCTPKHIFSPCFHRVDANNNPIC